MEWKGGTEKEMNGKNRESENGKGNRAGCRKRREHRKADEQKKPKRAKKKRKQNEKNGRQKARK